MAASSVVAAPVNRPEPAHDICLAGAAGEIVRWIGSPAVAVLAVLGGPGAVPNSVVEALR